MIERIVQLVEPQKKKAGYLIEVTKANSWEDWIRDATVSLACAL